ncbi:MAG TPA: hypothetical protein VNX88_23235 [Terriglobales bacterium]|jgi:hypothetical protein|nr:hypothetical protein [Terriglobales bacterium]
MVIKGVKHLAEISRMFDPTTHRERFRYALRHESSPDVLYWGHEHTEEAALEMANMYLTLLDDCVAEMRSKRVPRGEHVQLIASPTAQRLRRIG